MIKINGNVIGIVKFDTPMARAMKCSLPGRDDVSLNMQAPMFQADVPSRLVRQQMDASLSSEILVAIYPTTTESHI